MRRQTSGQSLVEMAFVLPIMIILIFAIIDMGYYIYVYSVITASVRNGAEEAAKAPPYPERLAQRTDPNAAPDAWQQDRCVRGVLDAVERTANSLGGTAGVRVRNLTTIDYPTTTDPRPRVLGKKIRVRVTNFPIDPLTPLFRFLPLTNDGRFLLSIETERTIEALGQDITSPNGVGCTRPVTP